MKIVRAVPVGNSHNALRLDYGSEIDFANGFLVGLDLDFYLSGTSSRYLINGINGSGSTALFVGVQGNKIIQFEAFYTFGGVLTISCSIEVGSMPKNVIFYFRVSGGLLNVSVYFENEGKVYTNGVTSSGTLRTVRHVYGGFYYDLYTLNRVLLVDTGAYTDAEIMEYFKYFRITENEAKEVMENMIDYAEPKDAFDIVLNKLVDVESVTEFNSVGVIKGLLNSMGYNVVNRPVNESKADGVVIGIYESGASVIEEAGADLIKRTNLVIEIQAPDEGVLESVIKDVEGVINFLNWTTPCSMTSLEIWGVEETAINLVFARAVVEIRFFKRRG